MKLEEAQARLAELNRKAKKLEEDVQKDGDERSADDGLSALS